MTPAQGRALEALGHAIEYLEDEATASDASRQGSARRDELDAIDTLKAISRSLWAGLPAREPLWRRFFDRHAPGAVVPLPLQ